MPFTPLKTTKYPPRLWCLAGYPGSGKSTFAAQMRGPLLVVDADHRFCEVASIASTAGKEVLALSDVPEDNVNADRIAIALNHGMASASPRERFAIGTIIVDSLTAIITPLVIQAMVDKQEDREKNLFAAWKTKALAMRQLQDAITRWGTDTLWIYHLQSSRDAAGAESTKATISSTELIRLTRSINMQLRAVAEKGKFGIKIVWARRGRSGITIWDDGKAWSGMPEKIEAAAYDGLTAAEQEKIELQPPEAFPSPDIAVAWAVDQGAFESIPHARNAYEKLKREKAPANANDMAAMWREDVQQRLAQELLEELNAGGNGQASQSTLPRFES